MKDDVISRQAAIVALHDEILRRRLNNVEPIDEFDTESILRQLPSAEPKTGRWIHQAKFSRIECDQCGKVFRNTFAPKNFCPNCGAKMEPKQTLSEVDNDTAYGGLMSAHDGGGAWEN